MPPAHDQVTLAILAGGEGSRMGQPKALLQIAGKPILAYLLQRFRWPGPTLLVTAPGREKPPGAELFSREVVDPIAGEGPLRGVLTALDASESAMVVIATVDMPGIGVEQLGWLIGELTQREDAMGAMCVRAGGQVEPFPAVFRQIAAPVIRARVSGNEKSIHSLAREGVVIAVPCGSSWPQAVWTNLNHPGDLVRWLRSGPPE